MYRKYANNVLVALVFALSVASIILTHALFAFVKNVQFETVVMKKDYSDDWPPFIPLTVEREVEMVVVHSFPGRSLRTSGGTKGDSASTARDTSAPTNCQQPDVRGLAPRPRALQLTNRTSKRRLPHHQHFLNYLRQKPLCHPDLTLEPGDFATRDFEEVRVGQTHVSQF
ncbi:hypothetical protein EDB83DRAFT_2321483 [Lactarius deliciosus]|nr:hypothetical protein EDB83DRAFT_2321483 [Lactarius deliciosus]